MAWTAQINRIDRQDDRVEIAVEVRSDAGDVRIYRYGSAVQQATQAWLRRQVRDTIFHYRVAEQELVVGAAVDLSPDPPPPPPPAPLPPDPGALPRARFLENWQHYQNLRRGADAGLFAMTDPLLTTLLSTLRQTWSPEYQDLLSF